MPSLMVEQQIEDDNTEENEEKEDQTEVVATDAISQEKEPEDKILDENTSDQINEENGTDEIEEKEDQTEVEETEAISEEKEEDGGRLEDDEEEEEMMPDIEDNVDLEIDVMGAHLEQKIHADHLDEVGAAGTELDVELAKENEYGEVVVVDPVVKSKQSEDQTQQPKSLAGADWIHAGIKKHAEQQEQAKKQRMLSRAQSPVQRDHGLAAYINDLHLIGFDEDEIDSMLKEVNIARMSEHVVELKKRVEAYLNQHSHSSDQDLLPHEHDELMVPRKHREALNSRVAQLIEMRREMESQFNVIGFSLFDTYFYLLLWCSSTFILAWFYCGYNCRVCYARRRPIYRFLHHKL